MSTELNTVLFDLDGTLVNTNELIIQSFLHTFDQFCPGRFRREDVIPFLGPPLRETFESINKDQVEEMMKCYREFNMAKHDEYVKEFDGVYDTVKKLYDSGVKMGIVTTKLRPAVEKGLKLSRLAPFFDVVVTLDDVKNAKPDPEPLFKALDQLGGKPEEAIMVGDNHHDIIGGKNAGTKTAAVAWSIKGEQFLRQFEPDYMLQEMEELLPIVGVTKK